jgi:hypothetical protein
MGVVTFCKYSIMMVNTFIDISNTNDLVLSLGLYVIYPAILYLLIDKFHGICGPETYLKKAEAIDACNTVFLWFTTLLRTSKLIHVIIFTVDADNKDGSRRSLAVLDSEDEGEDYHPTTSSSRPPASGGTALGGFMNKLQCQTWIHLTQELTIVGFVSFLLIVCLPVLAFWTMLFSVCTSICGLYSLIKRLWKDAHEVTGGTRGLVVDSDAEQDIEFSEFLSNFAEKD